jgi:hypothetical protein
MQMFILIYYLRKAVQREPTMTKLIFVHAINELLHELPANCVRINAWNGFLKRDVIEIVASERTKWLLHG